MRSEEYIKMNPNSIFKIMQLRNKFQNNHPKAVAFLQNVLLSGVPEGTVIEMSVTKPGEEKVMANMRVTADDLEMMNELKNLKE